VCIDSGFTHEAAVAIGLYAFMEMAMHKRYSIAAGAVALAALLCAQPASAAGQLSYFGVTADLQVLTGITTGPDGAIWMTGTSADGSTAGIGRMSTAGGLRDYPIPSGTKPAGIVSGPDGALWFGENGAIGRITTAGALSAFKLASATQVNGITVGRDRALWFTQDDATVGRITTAGQVAMHKVRFGIPGRSSPVPMAHCGSRTRPTMPSAI
jgi:streptogramin lyase